MRVLVIVNTASGGSDAGLYDYARALGTEGVEVTMRFAAPGVRIESFIADASSFDVIVAAGGDGTVSAVSYATRKTGIPVLVYPAGTANLLALNLGLPLDAERLARITLEGVPVDFDLGELEHQSTGTTTRTGFIMMAGAGYDAAIMESAQPLKPVFGATAYLLAAIGNIAPTVAEFQLTIDGREVVTDGIAVLLLNFGRIQFDLAVTHGWDARDGLLDVAVVRGRNPAELVPAVLAAMRDRRRGDHPDRSSGIEVHRGSSIEVVSAPPMKMQFDGETLDEVTPFAARSLSRQATLLVAADSPFASED